MPVKSRGSLLAGTVALASLIGAGAGCQSHPSDYDAFANPNNTGQITSGLFSRHGDSASTGSSPSPPIGGFVPTARITQGTDPVTLQPVPGSGSSAGGDVIASSWHQAQRINTESAVFGPETPGGVPSNQPPGNGQVLAVRSPAAAPMPVGSPAGIFIANAPALEDKNGDAAPSAGNTLPPPRALGAPPVVGYSGMMFPAHPFVEQPPVPREFAKTPLPPYQVEPPDILLIQAGDHVTLRIQRIEGQHLVGPDGTVNLGIYGSVRVVGMTLDQVADAVAARLLEKLPGLYNSLTPAAKTELGLDKDVKPLDTIAAIKRELQVDVLSYNSKVYYVITDGGGYGAQVYPIPITGNETVLDALAKVNGLPAVAAKKKIWVARATRPGQPPKVFPVDWCGVAKKGESATNYQIFPGDRVYVDSDCWIKTDTWLSKRLSPLLRGFGATLLGASTVNSIKNGTSSSLGASSLSGIR